MNKIKYLFLLVFLLASCSEKSSNDKTAEKKLDTSFLKLGQVSGPKVSSNLVGASHIHTLDTTQEITLTNPAEGKISISNFDYSKLKKDDVIVGNENDKYLFKFVEESVKDHSIIVTQGNFSDLVRDEKASIGIEVTPELNFEPSEERTYQKSAVRHPSLSEAEGNSIKSPEKTQINIIDFEDYKIIDITANNLILGKKLKSKKKTEINLHQGRDLKVTLDRGFVQLIPTFRGNFNFEGANDYNLKTSFDALLKFEFQVTVETSSKTMGEISLPLFKPKTFPIRIPGPVPVYADIEVSFPAGIKVGVGKEGKMTFTVKSEYALNATTFFDAKTGKKIESHYDYVIRKRSVDTEKVDTNYLFELYVEPRVETKFYRLLGPYAFINANVQANLKSPLRDKEEDLFVNFSGGVGVTLTTPLFNATLIDLQSPSLFKLSKGWDVIGPKGDNPPDYVINLKNDINLEIEKLDEENRVALNLRPSGLSPLGKVRIYDTPKFGRIAKSKNFESNGLAYYYPPKAIEGSDSFQIQVVDHGLESGPSRVILNLSQNAKRQVESDKILSLPRYDQSLEEQALVDNIVGLPSDVYSFYDQSGVNGGVRKERVVEMELPLIEIRGENYCDKDEHNYFLPKVYAGTNSDLRVEVTLLNQEKREKQQSNSTLRRMKDAFERILADRLKSLDKGEKSTIQEVLELVQREATFEEKFLYRVTILENLKNRYDERGGYDYPYVEDREEEERFYQNNLDQIESRLMRMVEDLESVRYEEKKYFCPTSTQLPLIEIKHKYFCAKQLQLFLKIEVITKGHQSGKFVTKIVDASGDELSQRKKNKLNLYNNDVLDDIADYMNRVPVIMLTENFSDVLTYVFAKNELPLRLASERNFANESEVERLNENIGTMHDKFYQEKDLGLEKILNNFKSYKAAAEEISSKSYENDQC